MERFIMVGLVEPISILPKVRDYMIYASEHRQGATNLEVTEYECAGCIELEEKQHVHLMSTWGRK